MRRQYTLLLILLLAWAIAGCHKDAPEPEQPATPTPEATEPQASTPQLLANMTPAQTPIETSEKSEAFAVTIDHALLFDPRTGPINAARSDEPGVHLLVAGTVRNQTGRLLHRAAIYATLIATFGERTELERHSGGLGFSERVTSIDPWRPDTERFFVAITRPLDPIYLELRPKKLVAALTIQARDPLEFNFRGEVAALPVDWDSILGRAVNKLGAVTVDGPCAGARQERKCDLERGNTVKILYQRGAAFKILAEDGRLLWLCYDRLALADQPAGDEPPFGTHFPITINLGDDLMLRVLRVAEYDTHEGISEDQKIYRVEVEITNHGEKNLRTPSTRDFALDTAAGGYASVLSVRSGTDGIYRQEVLRPGEKTEGALLFAREPGAFPFDLEIHLANKKPIRVPLFPALLALQNNGANHQ
ncbi:MAG: hypothetical protein ACTSXZ_06095 [Alphaproteobacteria bacterium]